MTPFQAMQHAVDVVSGSEHPTNKIASCLFNDDQFVTCFNYRPKAFIDNFELGRKLGSSSQYVHSEIGCILKTTFDLNGASLCITDPMCPNCAKGIAQSGIKHVYIDHKGMEKDFIKRRENDFETMSLLMMERAGISVDIVYRKEEKLESVLKSKQTEIGTIETPSKYAEATINDETFTIYEALPPNISQQEAQKCASTKYRFSNDSLTRLLIHLSSRSLKTDHVTCSHQPSSRALVNAVGFGITEISILSPALDHGEKGHETLAELEKNGILKINPLY